MHESYKPLCTVPENPEDYFKVVSSALLNIADAIRQLPPEELERYRAAQQSVINARNPINPRWHR
jgi:hypothetical protein